MPVGHFKSSSDRFPKNIRANVTRLPINQATATDENRTNILSDWELVTEWFVGNSRREGHTLRSQQAREERLRTFAKFAGGVPNDITGETVKQYVDDCLTRNLSHFTINSVLRTLRTLYSELAKEGYVGTGFNPAQAVRKLKEPLNSVVPLSPAEVQTLLATFDLTSWPELRDYTIVCLMLETGLRATECLNSRTQDLEMSTGALFVPPENAKGRKARSVYFGERITSILKDWLDKRGVECEYLFPSVYLDLSGDYHPLSRHGFEKRLVKYGKRAGVNVHAHQLRHTFAINYLRQSGGDLATCARQMGHSSVRVTERYLNVAASGVQRILVRQHSLLDNSDAVKPKRRRVDSGRRSR